MQQWKLEINKRVKDTLLKQKIRFLQFHDFPRFLEKTFHEFSMTFKKIKAFP